MRKRRESRIRHEGRVTEEGRWKERKNEGVEVVGLVERVCMCHGLVLPTDSARCSVNEWEMKRSAGTVQTRCNSLNCNKRRKQAKGKGQGSFGSDTMLDAHSPETTRKFNCFLLLHTNQSMESLQLMSASIESRKYSIVAVCSCSPSPCASGQTRSCVTGR